jgi:predicted dehydrogenase
LSESPEDSLEIIETAKQHKKFLFTSYMKRYLPAVAQAKTLLPQIGTIISARFFTRQPWGNLWEGEPENEYFRKPKGSSSKVRSTYGGGILHCGGSHILDLICFFIGKPNTVSAHMIMPEYLDYDISTTAVLEVGSVPVYFEALAHPLSYTGALADGWDEGFEILGTKGKLLFQSSLWDDVKSKTPLLIFEDNSKGIKKEYRYSPASPFSLAIKEFYHDIASGVQKCQSISSGYSVDQIISSIMKSNQEKKRLDIPWK